MCVCFVFVFLQIEFLIEIVHGFEFFVRIMAFSSNDIKVGTELEIDEAPWQVLGNFIINFSLSWA